MKTILKNGGPFILKEKNSVFISFVFNVKNKEEVKQHISELKKQFNDSTHICYAYGIIENGKKYYGYTDDGEVSGTAGLPVLNIIKSSDLYNIMIAVVRYYGGIKLGKGGLVRAYTESAKKIIGISEITDFRINKTIIVKIPFEMVGKILNIINKKKYEVSENITLQSGIKIKLIIPEDEIDDFELRLKNIGMGRIDIINQF